MQFLTNIALAALAILPAFGSPVPATPKAGDIIPDSYIVVLNEGVSNAAFQSHQSWASGVSTASLRKRGLEVRAETFDYTYNFGTLKGYAGTFDKETIEEIASRAEVAYVEPNAVVTTQAIVSSLQTLTLIPSSLHGEHRLPNLPFLRGDLAPSLTAPGLEPTTSMTTLRELVPSSTSLILVC